MAMEKRTQPISVVKSILQVQFLGKHGVHGVGLDHTNNIINIYVTKNNNSDQKKLLEDISNLAQSHSVRIISEDPPNYTSRAAQEAYKQGVVKKNCDDIDEQAQELHDIIMKEAEKKAKSMFTRSLEDVLKGNDGI